MGQSDTDGKEHQLNNLLLAFGFCFLFNILTISAVGYRALYTYQKLERMHEANKALRHDVDTVQKVNQNPKISLPRLALSLNLIFFQFWSCFYWGKATSWPQRKPYLRRSNRYWQNFLKHKWGWCIGRQ